MALNLGKLVPSPSFLIPPNSPRMIFSSSSGSSRRRSSLHGGFNFKGLSTRPDFLGVLRSTGSSSSNGSAENPGVSPKKEKVPFGYTRKDVLLIGVGVTVCGIGLKSGLEYFGVDPLQAGNVVQLVLVLGLTVGWISTYMFRVGNKEMTYAQQLRDYENKVMEKRLEGLTEAELEALLEQVDEEKRGMARGDRPI